MNRRMKERDGFTYIEVIIALLLLSVCLAPLLIMFPTGSKAAQLAALYTRATNLAEDMMEEIKGKAFEDPDQTPQWGPEGGGETPRTGYDDVDDYDNWVGEPPKDINNNTISGFEDFISREVDVQYAELNGDTWNGVGDGENGTRDYKMVTVTVKHPDMADVELVTIVANY